MKHLLAILFLLMPLQLSASESTKQAIAKELMEVMDVDSLMDTMYTHVKNTMDNAAHQLNVTESERPLFTDYYQSVNQLMQDQLNWDILEPQFITIYDKNFTEDELSAMLEFYKTEQGKSILKKMPAVMQESMLLSQSMLQNILPQLQTLSTQFDKELKAHRESAKQ
ncbi:DUF2059 domain-containing protein [Vibrio profundi]|uniref:DUF2059 domain-containing protein n=1 Tax=Vibrio profundi TaxID=1774960 RepID=UPI003736FA14